MSKTDPISSVSTTTFTENFVDNFGSIFVLKSFLELDQITFSNNETGGQTSGIALIMSSLRLENSSFANEFGNNGGCIYSSNYSVANITNCTVNNVGVEESGGFLFSIDSRTQMIDCTVSDASANSGAALTISYDSTLEVYSSIFENIHSNFNGGIIL